MLDFPKAQEFLQTFASARMAGDIDALMASFHNDATLRIVGLGPAVGGREAVRAMVEALVGEFEFLEWHALDTVVHGETIAVRQHLKVRHRQSGRVAETETAEFLIMRDGRCAAYTQFADTALVVEPSRS